MSRLQKILVLMVVLELASLAFVWRWRAGMGRLPEVDWSMVEEATANDIRGLESRFQPNDAGSWMDLAGAYRAFGLFPQADYCYREAGKRKPGEPGYLYRWGLCLDLMGRTREATKRYDRVIEKLGAGGGDYPDMVRYAWLNIGQDHLREEDVPAAIEALRKAGDLPKAKLLLSRVLIRSGRAVEATRLLDELLKKYPDVIDFNQMKSWAEAELGHAENAERYEELELRSRQQMPKWDPLYQQVLDRRNATPSEAWHTKSLELAAQGQLEPALEWSRKALAAFWTEERVQQLAKLQLQTGRVQEAIASAEDCVKRVGASAKTLDIMGVACVKSGDLPKAQRCWEQAVEIEPTPDLYAKLAEVRRLAGDIEKSREYRSLEQYQMGKEAWLKNDLKSAREHFEQAVTLWDRHAHTWFYLADTLRNLGEKTGADAGYRRCLQINPDYGRALKGLDLLNSTAASSSVRPGQSPAATP